MTTMSTSNAMAVPTGATAAPTFGRLMLTELRRLFSRRFTKVLLIVCAVGYLIAVGYIWQSRSPVTPADVAQATAQRDQQIVEIKAQIAQCVKDLASNPEQCGTAPTAAEYPIDQFLQNNPFRPDDVASFTAAVGVAVALAAFMLAATSIGAEWSTKNLVAWLFYEPRRLRLMIAKLLPLTVVILALSFLAQLLWGVTARLLIDHRGIPISTLGADQASHFWSDMTQAQLRAALLVIPMAWLGFGLANLIRNTAAALGVGFIFVLVVESVLRGISPSLQPYQVTTNVAGWMSPGGITVYGRQVFDPAQNGVGPEQIHISNLHGGVTLMIYAVVVLGASIALFRRRDIS